MANSFVPNAPVEDKEFTKFTGDQANDTAVRVVLGSGSLGTLLQGVLWDYVGVTYPDTVTEIYTFKNGGASGTTSAVINITYTDITKNFLDNVFRSA